MHDMMAMDEDTQLGYCDDCIDAYIKDNPKANIKKRM